MEPGRGHFWVREGQNQGRTGAGRGLGLEVVANATFLAIPLPGSDSPTQGSQICTSDTAGADLRSPKAWAFPKVRGNAPPYLEETSSHLLSGTGWNTPAHFRIGL